MLIKKIKKLMKKSKAEYAFFIKDLSSSDIYKYNEKEQVRSASLIKIFILIALMEQISSGKLNLSQELPLDRNKRVEYSVLEYFDDKKMLSLRELANLMIVYSDNTATNMLIELLGTKRINETISNLGLRDTVLNRKMMDFEAANRGLENMTSVKDMANILEGLYEGSVISAQSSETIIKIMTGQADENEMRRYLPDELRIARKTGELDSLLHEAAIVYTDKKDYIFVLFIWNAADCNEARELTANVSKLVYDELIH